MLTTDNGPRYVGWSPDRGWHETSNPSRPCTLCARFGVFRFVATCAADGHHTRTGQTDGPVMVRTDRLYAGDRVRLPGGSYGVQAVRTVAAVAPSGYVNARGEEILTVTYAEPDATSHGRWSGGNSGAPGSMWELATDGPQ